MFSQVHVTLANKLISDAGNYYPWRSYLETLLAYNSGAQKSQLTSAAFYLDTPGTFNSATANEGEKKRRKLFTKGDYVHLSGKICADIFEQNRPLITGVPLSIRLFINQPHFALRVYDTDQEKQFRFFIRNPRIHVKRYIPTPDYMLKMTEQLLTKPALYHIERSVIRVHDLAAGTQSTVISGLQSGQLPKVVYLALVSSKDFCGQVGRTPLFFDHFDLQQVSLEQEGVSMPSKPYQCKFPNNCLELYDGLLDVLQ